MVSSQARDKTGFLAAVGIVGFVFAPDLIALFRDDPSVVEFGSRALRFQCVTLWVQSWVVMSNMMMQSMGRTVPATFLAVARQGLFFVPFVLLLPPVLGALGIQAAQSAADILTFLCAIPIQLHVLHGLKEDQPH